MNPKERRWCSGWIGGSVRVQEAMPTEERRGKREEEEDEDEGKIKRRNHDQKSTKKKREMETGRKTIPAQKMPAASFFL